MNTLTAAITDDGIDVSNLTVQYRNGSHLQRKRTVIRVRVIKITRVASGKRYGQERKDGKQRLRLVSISVSEGNQC